MSNREHLLDDDQMRAYVRNGYVAVRADDRAELHASIFEQIETVLGTEGNPGNNILPRIPAFQDVLDHPRVAGALTSVMGPDYLLHPHRHCHFNAPGSEGQRLHKDGYTRRQHRTRWAMAMYYPQDVTVDMGPTGVAPGTHYNNTAPDPEIEVAMAGEAGTVTIVHYDIWHRGTPNRSDKNRYMVKFLVARMEEPEAPSWNANGGQWPSTGDIRDGMWAAMWDWHNGSRARTASAEDPDRLLQALRGESEPEALRAAYSLATLGESVVPQLIDALRERADTLGEDLDRYEGVSSGSQNATYALSAMGAPAVPALADAANDRSESVRALAAAAIGEMGRAGREGAAALRKALKDESDEVRRQAAEALGTVGADASAVPALIDALSDEEAGVRKASALSLARLGPQAEEAVPALEKALRDPKSYQVRGKAAHALRRIQTTAAHDALLKFLVTARWDHLTGKKG